MTTICRSSCRTTPSSTGTSCSSRPTPSGRTTGSRSRGRREREAITEQQHGRILPRGLGRAPSVLERTDTYEGIGLLRAPTGTRPPAARPAGSSGRSTCPRGTASRSRSRSRTRATGQPGPRRVGRRRRRPGASRPTPGSRAASGTWVVGDPTDVGSGVNALDWIATPGRRVRRGGATTSMTPADADFRTLYLGFAFENRRRRRAERPDATGAGLPDAVGGAGPAANAAGPAASPDRWVGPADPEQLPWRSLRAGRNGM